jgi:hypothetical protein
MTKSPAPAHYVDTAREEMRAAWEHGKGWPYVSEDVAHAVDVFSSMADVDMPDLDDRDAVRAFVEEHTTTTPQCATPGCTRDAAYDGERPAGGYFANCERCSSISGTGLHAHRRTDTWTTSTTLHPIVSDDVITGYECRTPLPGDRGECGFKISRADVEAYRADSSTYTEDIR